MDSSGKTGSRPAAKTVSIIVPVYNTAQYLDRCARSLAAQSYPQLEILLVDDGSTDGSGALCDRWAEADRRFRVVHRENGGLSAARNTGIDAAAGDYLAFVDSDDYVAETMVEKLLTAVEENRADLGICNFLYVDEHGEPLREYNRDLPVRDEAITGEEALERIFTEKGWYYVTAWNKLYARELFRDVRFPLGKIHEDEFTAHHLLGACSCVACVADVGYYYVQRSGSIMHSRSCRSNLHAVEANLDRADYLHAHGMHRLAGRAYLIAGMYLAEAFAGANAPDAPRAELQEALTQYRSGRRFLPYCTAKEKLQVSLVCRSPGLYNRLFQNRARRALKQKLGFYTSSP